MLAGDLKADALITAWNEIAAAELVGVLEIVSGKQQWEFLFREGTLIGSRKKGRNNAEHIVELLLEGGALRPETVRDALKKQSKVMKSCLEILMEEGHVPLILYSRTLSAVLRLDLLEVLPLRTGTYQFAAKESLREEAGAKPLEHARFTAFVDRIEGKPRLMKAVMASLFSPIEMLEERSFPFDGKTLFYSYAAADRDLFDFLPLIAELIEKRSLLIERSLFGSSPGFFLAAIFFRAAALLLVAAVAAAVFAARPNRYDPARVVAVRAIHHKATLLSREVRFASGERMSFERLQQAGLLTAGEYELLSDSAEKP